MYSGTPFSVVFQKIARPVRIEPDDVDAMYAVDLGSGDIGFDLPEDLAQHGEGEWVTLDFGRFELAVRASGDRIEHRAGARIGVQRVHGAVADDDEAALWDLAARLPPDKIPRACFFCRYSDVEPSTGWGHLACLVEVAAQYDEIATRGTPRERKWVTLLSSKWTDEWHGCERWAERPVGYGYRGRTGRVSDDLG